MTTTKSSKRSTKAAAKLLRRGTTTPKIKLPKIAWTPMISVNQAQTKIAMSRTTVTLKSTLDDEILLLEILASRGRVTNIICKFDTLNNLK